MCSWAPTFEVSLLLLLLAAARLAIAGLACATLLPAAPSMHVPFIIPLLLLIIIVILAGGLMVAGPGRPMQPFAPAAAIPAIVLRTLLPQAAWLAAHWKQRSGVDLLSTALFGAFTCTDSRLHQAAAQRGGRPAPLSLAVSPMRQHLLLRLLNIPARLVRLMREFHILLFLLLSIPCSHFLLLWLKVGIASCRRLLVGGFICRLNGVSSQLILCLAVAVWAGTGPAWQQSGAQS